jgi:hypothetical protein
VSEGRGKTELPFAGSTNCVICSHRHENGCTAAVEAPEVAVSQVPVFNVTTESDYDILFNCF